MITRSLLSLLLTLSALPAQDIADILEREALQAQFTVQELKKAHADPAQITAAEQELNHITARNERFVSRLGGAIFKVYGFNPTITTDYLRQATTVYQQYRQLFPTYEFSAQTTAHLLVYPDPSTYLKYERMPYGVAGHAQSQRVESKRFRRTAQGLELDRTPGTATKLQRLALYQAPANSGDSVTFGHELAHIFTWDLLNQNSSLSQSRQPNLFLNEGLSEYMATLGQPAQQQLRLQPLRALAAYVGPKQWLDLASYPADSYVREFYSEAYLFVRWLAEQPQPGRRLQALLKSRTLAEFQDTLRVLPMEQPVERIALEDYDKFRQRVLSNSQ